MSEPTTPPHSPRPWWQRALRVLAVWTLGVVLVFEEWGWQPLQNLLARVLRGLGLEALERRIAALPPRAALALFALPALALLPIKLLALYWIAQGHQLLGIGLIVAAKVAGTAFVARLFTLTQPALMRLAWFAVSYTRWAAWKAVLLAHVHASWAWRVGRVVKRRVAQRLARWRTTA